MGDAVRVRELVQTFEAIRDGEEVDKVARVCLDLVHGMQGGLRERVHVQLCAAMCSVSSAGGHACRELLYALGKASALSAISSNIPQAPMAVAQWLAKEVLFLVSSHHLIFDQCGASSALITPHQQHLVNVICRLPDLLSNRLGRSLDPSLLPRAYFTTLAHSVVRSLEEVHKSIRGSVDCSVVFPSTLVGKAALLGQKDVIFPVLVPALEAKTLSDPLWQRIAHRFFSHIPNTSLEQVLDAVTTHCTPSLSSASPMKRLIGDLVLDSVKAKFLLTQKAFLVKVPSEPRVLYCLVGYLTATKPSRALLVDALIAVLGVWSDSSALRHLDSRQHLWLSRLLVLGTVCLRESEIVDATRTKMQQLTMAGIQAHVESPLEETRQVGMAVGEHMMNWLNPTAEHQLHFEYEASEEVRELLSLTRPVAVQEEELKQTVQPPSLTTSPSPPTQPPSSDKQFGKGLVQTSECADSDSDDDLVPYAMGEDPDSSEPTPPRYLRTCLQALISTENPAEQEAALKVAESLVRSSPPDLPEVAVEMTKVLLHLSDTYALPDFTGMRHRAMVSLAVQCPVQIAEYLTCQFYAPNYSIRQRLDLLEVLSDSALELSSPLQSLEVTSQSMRPAEGRPWEEVIRERLRAKTRIISKGPRKMPPNAAPSRFAPVASIFFFPLMSRFDSPLNTLDLPGQDSLVLGRLLHTLGIVIHAATHAPTVPRMAAALMDFVWGLRYHPSAYVRQGILFALGMLLAATPTHTLISEMEETLSETVHWLNDTRDGDSDRECRSLAQHNLTLLHSSLLQEKGYSADH